MDEFLKVFGSVTVASVFVFLAGVAFVVAGAIKVKDFIIFTHDSYQERCERVEGLVESFNDLKVRLEDIIERVDKVEAKLGSMEKESNSYRLASLRDKIFKDYQVYLQQGGVTDSQLKNFEANVSEYTKRGGNSVVLNKYAPEVRELPIVK